MKEPAPLQSAEGDPWAGSRLGKIETKMKNTEHVMADESGLSCNHCGEVRQHPRVPEKAIDYADRLLGFVRTHRPCKKAPLPDRQLKLETADAAMGAASPYAKFNELYPLPRTLEELLDACSFGLTGEQFKALREKCHWHPDQGMFHAAATWGRIEHAHYDAALRARNGAPAIGGLTVPARIPMPEKLAELIAPSPEAPAKKKRSRKA